MQPRVSRLDNQMRCLNVEYNLNWYKFESRIRKVVEELLMPLKNKNESI